MRLPIPPLRRTAYYGIIGGGRFFVKGLCKSYWFNDISTEGILHFGWLDGVSDSGLFDPKRPGFLGGQG